MNKFVNISQLILSCIMLFAVVVSIVAHIILETSHRSLAILYQLYSSFSHGNWYVYHGWSFKMKTNNLLTYNIMSINFKKLNSQIKPLKPEARHVGYIFIATDKQKRESLVNSIAKPGSKRSLIKVLTYFIKTDENYRAEYSL